MKKPLWADSTALCAENWVRPGPTCNVTSGIPGSCTVEGTERFSGAGVGSVDGSDVIAVGSPLHGPRDNQARYREYIAKIDLLKINK